MACGYTLLYVLKDYQNSVFDILEAIVILLQDLSGPGQVKVLFTGVPPGKAGQPVEVVTGHTG